MPGRRCARFAKIEAVGDERGHVDPPIFQQPDDLAEGARQPGAARQQGEFAAVKIRIVESHFADEQS